MTDEMERIWAEDPDIFDDMGIYCTSKTKGLVEYVRGDIVQKLIGERNHTWEMLTRADALISKLVTNQVQDKMENTQLREALNQSRLAFAGYVSVQSAIDLIDRITPREDKSAK